MFGDALKKAAGKAGKAIDVIGKSPVGAALRATPAGAVLRNDYKISENLERLGGMIVPKTYASEKSPSQVQGASTSVGGAYPIAGGSPKSGGSYYNTSSYSQPMAMTSGQPSDGGGDAGYDYIGALRNAFSQSRSALEGMLPTYDADFSNFKNTVEGGVNRARETMTAQNAEDERIYGEDWGKTLRMDKELRQRRQGQFSALNALDSSAYRDETLKSDQELIENRQSLDAEKRRNFDSRQREFAAYEQEATGKIAQYENEIARAKQALQQSIANVNMEEAASIQNYIEQLQSQASQIGMQREALAMNLAQLQAQGTDVVGALSKLNMSGFSNLFGQNLANRYNSQLSRLAPAQQGFNGAGYIGRGMNDDQLRQLGIIR